MGPGSEDLAFLLTDAEAGIVEAQWALGAAFRKEAERLEVNFGEIEWREAARWFGKAAAQGDPRAQLNLGQLYLRGAGVAKDATVAASLVSAAANQGLPDAQLQMGEMLLAGDGVNVNPQWARYWLELVAETEADCARDAQYRLGVMYEAGEGVEVDLNKALDWFREAACRGSHAGGLACQAIKRKGVGRIAVGNTPRLPGEIRRRLDARSQVQ